VQLFIKILSKFNGLRYRQEYLCIGKESFQHPLYAYLLHNGKPVKDITNLHCFVGYSPLILALPANSFPGYEPSKIEIAFTGEPFTDEKIIPQKKLIAFLELQKISDYDSIIFFEGRKGRHRFTNWLNQFAGGWINNLNNRKPGNVFLENELYKQVQVAYSVPRKISLITVGNGELFNHFPTDLHGQAGNLYIISLRHEGLACKQVIQAGKIVLSDMEATAYKAVYALGKNHMQPLKPRSAFNFSENNSPRFNLPLPLQPMSYKELELVHSFNHGIHKLLIFSIVYEEVVNTSAETLVHIHNCYASWRDKNGLKSNYLLR
jgi:hypothetical protein